MKLYHFCRAPDLDSIAEKGLYPHVPTEPVMSLGEEVVSQETREVDETDIKHFHHLGLHKEQIERMARNGWLLDTNRTHRLTVRIRSGRRLKQYGEWLLFNRDRPILENGVDRTNDRGEIYSVKHLIQSLSPNALSTWWVYFGGIPPSMIEALPERIKKSKKPKPSTDAEAEENKLDVALNKFILSETCRRQAPSPRGFC
jgi:hypothetical protein